MSCAQPSPTPPDFDPGLDPDCAPHLDRGRRRWLWAAAAFTIAPALQPRVAAAHNDAGPVAPPLAAPAMAIHWHDGSRRSLADRLKGRVTAVQTMFTGCSAVCPIQGALFAEVQSLLGEPAGGDPRLQLLSLSIDPVTDDAPALSRWLRQFEGDARWHAGAPRPEAVDQLLEFLRARSGGVDRHTGQVFLFNPRAELVLRTVDLPPPEQIVELLLGLAKRFPR
ncbi:MAG: SCO family protein [Lautropia sp.]